MNFKEYLKESSITISYNTDSILDLTGSRANITKLLKLRGETDTDISDYIEQ